MKLCIYLVEDSPIIRKLLRELIEGTNATVIGEADDAARAIADVVNLRPDVVVIDLALREGSGFDVLRALRDQFGASRPVRIVLSNYTLAGYRAAAQRLGADYFFDKSNQIHEMMRTLRNIPRAAERANGGSG